MKSKSISSIVILLLACQAPIVRSDAQQNTPVPSTAPTTLELTTNPEISGDSTMEAFGIGGTGTLGEMAYSLRHSSGGKSSSAISFAFSVTVGAALLLGAGFL